MRKRKPLDTEILEGALEGLELQRRRIEQQIAAVRRLLSLKPHKAAVIASKPVRKRLLSPQARKRIATAQKRRWAEYRRSQAELHGGGGGH